MLKSAMIRARVEPGLKNEVEAIFQALGLNATEALCLFYMQVKLKKGLPFEVKIPEEKNPSAVADKSRKAIIAKTKSMTGEERLEAFYNHSYLMNQMAESGREKRKGALRAR